MPNIVVHLTEPLESRPLPLKLLGTSRLCNEQAKVVLLLGHRSPILKTGTMLSDLGKNASSFETKDPDTLIIVNSILKTLKCIRKLNPKWEAFKPKKMIAAGLYGTHHVWQTYGFMPKMTLDKRVYLGFDPPNAFERREDCKDRPAHGLLK